MNTELELLQEIDQLHQQILSETNGNIYSERVEELFRIVLILHKTYHPEYISSLHPGQLIRIINLNLGHVRKSYERAQNSTRIVDNDSFVASLSNTNYIIQRRLFGLFRHIDQLKQEGQI